jgi:hypothetical protein
VHGSNRSNFRRSTFRLKIQLLILKKTLQRNLSWLQIAFSSSAILKETPSGERSSLTLESKMCLKDLPMRQRPVKLPYLRLTFSSFSKPLQQDITFRHIRDISCHVLYLLTDVSWTVGTDYRYLESCIQHCIIREPDPWR